MWFPSGLDETFDVGMGILYVGLNPETIISFLFFRDGQRTGEPLGAYLGGQGPGAGGWGLGVGGWGLPPNSWLCTGALLLQTLRSRPPSES